ncbi:carbon-nitrogen hydrolase family protein [Denitrobaculum tricleocarpae]|uniref:Carbon-nitrogen hydrolase family protein n=1 Tax=Denitrobaculum tricleocarpae TaxID=2591009 RepID=A0A545T7N2_9PROT|nr:carbon-nitrogen hydrolase family protein [Denitrobaculum tricleocarpae]TQV73233.1 carbon-nitrogen hydrolase family protein [Denitrobaculum tricleocarpae]
MSATPNSGAPFTAACIQTNTGPDHAPSLKAAEALIREAHGAGADLIMTPEVTSLLESRRAAALEKSLPEESHPGIPLFRALAAELQVWLLAGSFGIGLGDNKIANRSFLFGPDGNVKARYDKIHMFDVEIPDGQTYRESATYRAGEKAVVTDLPWGRLGLTICYDLRFPPLYRVLAEAGASFITVPSAFTRLTGAAHWHTLLKARAIETGCYIFAPAQCGTHAGGRETYGHSLIVSPWGEVLAEGGEEPGVVMAKIDPAAVGKARSMVPSLTNVRDYAPPD